MHMIKTRTKQISLPEKSKETPGSPSRRQAKPQNEKESNTVTVATRTLQSNSPPQSSTSLPKKNPPKKLKMSTSTMPTSALDSNATLNSKAPLTSDEIKKHAPGKCESQSSSPRCTSSSISTPPRSEPENLTLTETASEEETEEEREIDRVQSHEEANANNDKESTENANEPPPTTTTTRIPTPPVPTVSPTNIRSPVEFLPMYLRHYVEHSHGDFFVSPFFDARIIAHLMYEGFLPIATPRYLVPKLHKYRSVIYPLHMSNSQNEIVHVQTVNEMKKQQQQKNGDSNRKSKRSEHAKGRECRDHDGRANDSNGNTHTEEPTRTPKRNDTTKSKTKPKHDQGNSQTAKVQSKECTVHTSKSTKKKSNRFTMTINRDFDEVVKGCHAQHGIGWLYPPIVREFKKIHQATVLKDDEDDIQTTSYPVGLYSIEVWNAQTGQLAGGELGYVIGTIYTSLTGFSREDSAGSVQLAALGHLLWSKGFDMWDLGMQLNYKSNLGAKDMERTTFVEKVKELRQRGRSGGDGKGLDLLHWDDCHGSLNAGNAMSNEPRNCKTIIVGSTRNGTSGQN